MRVYENIPYETAGPTGFPQSNCPKSSNWPPGKSSAPILSPQQQQQPPIPSQPLIERPMTLSFENGGSSGGNKLRSSLKKHIAGNGGRRGSSASAIDCTPTKPTPSDSLTSDDSSYMSARDGYSSISSTHSRVRFSPETMLDAASGQELATAAVVKPRLSRRHMSLASDASEQMSTS